LKTYWGKWVLGASLTCSMLSVAGEETFKAPGEEAKLTEELAWLNAESYNTTAFKFKDQTNKSPGSIAVITAQDIKDMGARNLLEALDTIPGISAYKGAYNQRIQVRGILRTSSQDVLMMINGLPVTNNYIGSGLWVYNSMSLDFVKRIEVIKGPASSLYGANAFSAIINVITKDSADLDGIEFNQKFASEDSSQTSFIFGKAFENGLELSGYVDFLETDGFSDTVVQDRQTYLDSKFGTDASLAPGGTDNHENKIHLGMAAKFHGFFLDTMWTDRERGPNVGIYDALSDTSLLKQEDGYINFGYAWEATRNLTLTPNVYYHHNRMDNRLQLLPPGTTIPEDVTDKNSTPINLPLGVESRYVVTNVRQGTELRADWDMLDNYKMVLGVNYEKMRQKDIEHYANHYFEDSIIKDLPEEQEITGDLAHIQREERTFKAFYIENLWDVTDNLRLTFGGRYDHYSDFGGTFNPRMSLIWGFAKDYDFKFMYGRAFRAPSFYELYSELPYAMGNPDLDPETIDSLEASITARFTKDLTMTFTTFYNEIKDSIQEVPQPTMIQFGNTDEVVSNGFETEARYNLGRGSYLTANYTYQHAYNKETNARVGRVPLHYAYFATNFRLARQLNWYTSVNWQSAPNIRREDKDKENGYREFGQSYAVVNTGFTVKDLCEKMKNVELRAFVYNLFDKEYFTDYSAEIPYGVPAPGRQFMFELKVKF